MIARRTYRWLGISRAFSAYLDKDLYKILGVTKSTDKKAIKAAYASLVKQHHPDVKKGDDALFKDINLAYSVLSNDEKKQEYDQYLEQKNKIRDFQGRGSQTYSGVGEG